MLTHKCNTCTVSDYHYLFFHRKKHYRRDAWRRLLIYLQLPSPYRSLSGVELLLLSFMCFGSFFCFSSNLNMASFSLSQPLSSLSPCIELEVRKLLVEYLNSICRLQRYVTYNLCVIMLCNNWHFKSNARPNYFLYIFNTIKLTSQSRVHGPPHFDVF